MVGLHHDRGVLWWSHPSQGESLIAVGGDNTDDVVYYTGTADFELPPGSELPRPTVIAAAVEFLTTGRRPTLVRSWLDEQKAFAQPHPVPHAS
jgi:Immunity protein Imm1